MIRSHQNGATILSKIKTRFYKNQGDVDRKIAEKVKQFDEQVRVGALDLADAAASEDLDEVLVKFNEMNKSCVGCHKTFRD